MSTAEYRSLAKRNKYGAKTAYRCEPCGGYANKTCCLACQSQKVIRFPSQGEAKRYDKLRDMQDKGKITGLELQPAYPIFVRGQKVCKVVLDFRYLVGGRLVVEDFKGHDNSLSRLKRKLVKAAYGFDVQVVKA